MDAETLRVVQSSLEWFAIVSTTEFVPDATDPRRVDATLDARQYPPSVVESRLEVHWFLDGDFGVHYVEVHRDESRWQCRWDRHENPHNDRLHFHPPPDAGSAVDLDCSPHVRDLLPTVLQWVEERIADGWEPPTSTRATEPATNYYKIITSEFT